MIPTPRASILPALLTLSASVFCVAFYITQGPDLGFSSRTGLAILAIAILSFEGLRVGGDAPEPSDVRLLGAPHSDLRGRTFWGRWG